MKLLQEIEQSVKLRPFADLLEAIADSGISAEDEDIKDIVAEHLETLKEMGRGDYDAAVGLAKGAGYDPRHEAKRRGSDSRFSNPRLSLTPGGEPDIGSYVFMGGGQGWGKVSRVEGDSCMVQDKRGRQQEIPCAMLKSKRIKHPKTGKPMMVWVEK